VDAARVDAGQVDDHVQLGRVLGAHEVDRRPEAAARDGEAGSVPELAEDIPEVRPALDVVAGRHAQSVSRRPGPK